MLKVTEVKLPQQALKAPALTQTTSRCSILRVALAGTIIGVIARFLPPLGPLPAQLGVQRAGACEIICDYNCSSPGPSYWCRLPCFSCPYGGGWYMNYIYTYYYENTCPFGCSNYYCDESVYSGCDCIMC